MIFVQIVVLVGTAPTAWPSPTMPVENFYAPILYEEARERYAQVDKNIVARLRAYMAYLQDMQRFEVRRKLRAAINPTKCIASFAAHIHRIAPRAVHSTCLNFRKMA